MSAVGEVAPAALGRFGFRRLGWFVPAAFAVDIVEEFATGFADWATHTLGAPMTAAAFVLNNAGFMAILLGLRTWVTVKPSRVAAFLLLSWASGNLFWNFVFHLATAAAFDRYSPGLATAVLLYYPLSLAVARAALAERVLTRSGLAAAAIAAALMLMVIWTRLLGFET